MLRHASGGHVLESVVTYEPVRTYGDDVPLLLEIFQSYTGKLGCVQEPVHINTYQNMQVEATYGCHPKALVAPR